MTVPLSTVRQQGARERETSLMFREGRVAGALDLKREDDTARLVAGGYREAVERELAAAKEITRAAKAGLTQADVMLTVVQVEKENLVAKMIKETLPLFAERLKEALIIREKRWNDDVKRRRFATAGAVTLALVCAAYGVRAWQDSAVTGAFYRCLAQLLQASGHFYCDVTAFFATPNQ